MAQTTIEVAARELLVTVRAATELHRYNTPPLTRDGRFWSCPSCGDEHIGVDARVEHAKRCRLLREDIVITQGAD